MVRVTEPEPLFVLEPSAAAGGPALSEMTALPLRELVAPDWADALADVEDELRSVLSFVAGDEAAGHQVLIVGQDPYPTPGHAVGLAFSVDGRTRPIPRSLANIYKELESDLGYPARTHGDLGAWAGQGVLLLNRVLSVREGAAGSHRGKGWETITTAAVAAVAGRRTAEGSRVPLVAVLWGKDAENVRPLLGETPVVASAHPSPLSASRGFFGSRPFSRANALLEEQGARAVDWELPPFAPGR